MISEFMKMSIIQQQLAVFDLNNQPNIWICHNEINQISAIWRQNGLKSNYDLIIFDYQTPFDLIADAWQLTLTITQKNVLLSHKGTSTYFFESSRLTDLWPGLRFTRLHYSLYYPQKIVEC